MIRKVSCKAPPSDDRNKKADNKAKDNQYYLPHPQVKIVKFNQKDIDSDISREKNHIKSNRKQSYNPIATTSSVALFKIDSQNHSKELQSNNPNKNYATKKVEGRKIRSTSNGETPKKPLSKSSFKLQLTGRKREGTTKRINLQIETPTTKKPIEKLNLHEMNYDSYYSNNHIVTESKSIRTLKKPESAQTLTASADLQQLYTRCKLIIDEYEDQLESVKRENAQLQEQNRRLKLERSPQARPSKD